MHDYCILGPEHKLWSLAMKEVFQIASTCSHVYLRGVRQVLIASFLLKNASCWSKVAEILVVGHSMLKLVVV